MDILDAIRANLLSPAVLFFALGLIAALMKSDLKFPEPLYVALTIYLLVAIGFKGGVATLRPASPRSGCLRLEPWHSVPRFR